MKRRLWVHCCCRLLPVGESRDRCYLTNGKGEGKKKRPEDHLQERSGAGERRLWWAPRPTISKIGLARLCIRLKEGGPTIPVSIGKGKGNAAANTTDPINPSTHVSSVGRPNEALSSRVGQVLQNETISRRGADLRQNILVQTKRKKKKKKRITSHPLRCAGGWGKPSLSGGPGLSTLCLTYLARRLAKSLVRRRDEELAASITESGTRSGLRRRTFGGRPDALVHHSHGSR